jgi:flagellin-like hook-associated protein FlgL
VGLTGDAVFGAMSSEVAGYKDLTPALSDGIRLADLAGASGAGVRLGTIVINDGVSLLQVDLTGADKIGEVVNKINDAGGGVITAAIDPAGNLTLASTNPGADLKVTEYGSGRTAHDLGIYRPTGQGAGFSGDDLNPCLTVTTALADLADGAGLDLASGLTITNGGHSATLEFSTDTTVGDLLNRINTADLGVLARINADGTGIDIVNTLSGSQLRIGENGGTTADDLGLRSLRGATALSALNDGTGVRTIEGRSDFQITARDGGSFQVNLDGAETLADAIDLINAAATAAGVSVSAGLAVNGNGIELTDATGGAGDLAVLAMNASSAAEDLGIYQTVSSSTLTGDDVNGIQPGGVFAHLAQLRDALIAGDNQAITRAAGRVKDDYDSIVSLRAGIGGTTRDLENREDRTEDQSVANQALLSNLKDADLTEAITRFQALQTALQANYTAGAQMLSMSLLDFLR